MIIKNFGYKIWQTLQTSYGALSALVDDTIKGVLRSIGDAGDSPANTQGKTLLQLEHDILAQLQVQLRKFYIETEEETIPADGVWYIASGKEFAVKNKLTVEGRVEIQGKLVIV